MPKIAGCQTEEEFYQTLREILANRSSSNQGSAKPDSLPSSSTSSSSDPVIIIDDDKADQVDLFGNSGF